MKDLKELLYPEFSRSDMIAICKRAEDNSVELIKSNFPHIDFALQQQGNDGWLIIKFITCSNDFKILYRWEECQWKKSLRTK